VGLVGGLRRCFAGLVLVAMVETSSQPLSAQSAGGASAANTSSLAIGYGQSVQFSGYTWLLKVASMPTGPGPNYFSDDPESAWVDDTGQLHLRLAQHDDGLWYAAEVVCTATFGYGSYRFSIGSPVDALDPNVVLGLFTWNDDPEQNHREIDIEFAQFGDRQAIPGRYTVQPYQQTGNTFEFVQPPVAQSLNMFTWSPGAVAFQSQVAREGEPREVIAQHTLNRAIPTPGGEHVRMNLWLDQGNPPTDEQPVEIVIQSFSYSPD
jgi:hypothetical protein